VENWNELMARNPAFDNVEWDIEDAGVDVK
jgi:hypothetical protein